MEEEINEEFELQEVDDTLHGSVGSRLSLFSKAYGLGKGRAWESENNALEISKCCNSDFVVRPNGR
jgi:hypothetical protein